MTEVTASGHGATPGVKVDGVKVLGAQGAVIADANVASALAAEATDSPARGDVDTSLDAHGTKINLILAALRTHGIIDTA